MPVACWCPWTASDGNQQDMSVSDDGSSSSKPTAAFADRNGVRRTGFGTWVFGRGERDPRTGPNTTTTRSSIRND